MSPSLQQTEQPIEALELTPSQKRQLSAALDTYAMLKADYDLLEEQLGIEKSKIGKVLADYGADKVRTEAFSLCWVRGSVTNTLDKKRLVAQGVTLAQIENAMVQKARKDYFTVRGLAEKTGGSEE